MGEGEESEVMSGKGRAGSCSILCTIKRVRVHLSAAGTTECSDTGLIQTDPPTGSMQLSGVIQQDTTAHLLK